MQTPALLLLPSVFSRMEMAPLTLARKTSSFSLASAARSKVKTREDALEEDDIGLP
jgi:hypothetical protein